MTKTEERRVMDQEVHKEIIAKLTDNSNKLIVIDERQQTVLKRLDQINGTVTDYNKNKLRFEQTCVKVETHTKEHEVLDERYIGRRLFVTLTVILGLLIVIFNLLQYFKIG